MPKGIVNPHEFKLRFGVVALMTIFVVLMTSLANPAKPSPAKSVILKPINVVVVRIPSNFECSVTSYFISEVNIFKRIS